MLILCITKFIMFTELVYLYTFGIVLSINIIIVIIDDDNNYLSSLLIYHFLVEPS